MYRICRFFRRVVAMRPFEAERDSSCRQGAVGSPIPGSLSRVRRMVPDQCHGGDEHCGFQQHRGIQSNLYSRNSSGMSTVSTRRPRSATSKRQASCLAKGGQGPVSDPPRQTMGLEGESAFRLPDGRCSVNKSTSNFSRSHHVQFLNLTA